MILSFLDLGIHVDITLKCVHSCYCHFVYLCVGGGNADIDVYTSLSHSLSLQATIHAT